MQLKLQVTELSQLWCWVYMCVCVCVSMFEYARVTMFVGVVTCKGA